MNKCHEHLSADERKIDIVKSWIWQANISDTIDVETLALISREELKRDMAAILEQITAWKSRF